MQGRSGQDLLCLCKRCNVHVMPECGAKALHSGFFVNTDRDDCKMKKFPCRYRISFRKEVPDRMETISDETLKSIEQILAECDHILEIELPDNVIDEMEEQIAMLQQRSEEYIGNLADQEQHSRSASSRDMAALLLAEEEKIRELIEKELASVGNRTDVSETEQAINVCALCVEYLTGRARQSIREALIGAMNLKILSKKLQLLKTY